MDPGALEQKMLEAAIAASLQEFQKHNRESSSQSSASPKGKSKAAQDASEISPNSISKDSSRIAGPVKTPHQPKETPENKMSPPSESRVVDLTNDSDSDSDLKEFFPKSKSVIGSETDEDATNDVGDDESDEDLKQAIRMSLEGAKHGAEVSHLQGPAFSLGPLEGFQAASPDIPKPQGIFGLNRKQMEEERLARLAKRKAGSSPPPAQPAPKASRIIDTRPPMTAHIPSSQTTPKPLVRNSPAAKHPVTGVQATARPVLQFPLGAVKKTQLAYAPRTGDDITIEEVFQREDLNVAVLSSFLWDIEWLFSKFDTKKTKFILIMGAKEEATVRGDPSSTGGPSRLHWSSATNIGLRRHR